MDFYCVRPNGKGSSGKGFSANVHHKLMGVRHCHPTVGSVFHGILDIYGTTGSLSKVYFIVGAVLLLVAVMTFIGDKEKRMADARIA